MMTDEQWESICFLVEEWWPPSPAEGDFDEHRRKAWRLALDGFEAEVVVTAVKALLFGGEKWRPRVAEVIAQIRKDPSLPTFEECYRLIYGTDGVLSARLPRGPFADAGEMARAQNEARKARAAELHPLVGSFAVRYGISRLAALEVDHPEYGELRRKELREAWGRHCEAMEGREVAALASGRREQLARFDPLAAIGGKPAQITEEAST